jgi:dienelactone hydrolase
MPPPESRAPATTEVDTGPSRGRRRGRRHRRLVIGTLLLLGLAGAVFLIYARPQPLLPDATAALVSDAEVEVSTVGGDLVFRPTREEPHLGLILYPGGKVPPAAYAPVAHRIAAMTGALVTVVDVPFNLAVLDIDAADRVIRREPGVTTWAIGGHSLGGAMAAQYAASHPSAVRGLVLWASYSAADLSTSDLEVLSIYGSLDSGYPSFRDPENLARLPDDTVHVEISGGNHEQFGAYTGQPDDPPATISRDEQQSQVAIATASFLSTLALPATE